MIWLSYTNTAAALAALATEYCDRSRGACAGLRGISTRICRRARPATVGILAICGLIHTAKAETFSVSSNGAHVESIDLTLGTVYTVQASGAVNFWLPNSNLADAAWQQVTQNSPAWSWDYGLPVGTTTGLWINGAQVDWLGTTNGVTFATDTFSPSHVYEYSLTGTGQPADFYYYDGPGEYGDNSGSFQVTINTSIPEPESALPTIVLGIVSLALSRSIRKTARQKVPTRPSTGLRSITHQCAARWM